MHTAGNIIELRQLLAERFPGVRMGPPEALPVDRWPTGIEALDELLGGGLPRGEFTELVGRGAGSGSGQVIHALLHQTTVAGGFLALVDGADSFDAGAVRPDALHHLLWARCTQTGQALKAADLLLRDRNFPLVVVDLKCAPLRQLRSIPGSTWHRLARLLEHSGAAALFITPSVLVQGAACRVQVECGLGSEALSQTPAEISTRLRYTLLRSVRSGMEAAQTG